MEMTLEGRAAFQDNRPDAEECGYDVSYETLRSLLVEDVGTGDEQISDGELTLTVNDSGGQSFNVEYNDGTVLVDGEPLDPATVDEFCPGEM